MDVGLATGGWVGNSELVGIGIGVPQLVKMIDVSKTAIVFLNCKGMIHNLSFNCLGHPGKSIPWVSPDSYFTNGMLNA